MLTLSPPGFMTNREREIWGCREIQNESTDFLDERHRERGKYWVMLIHMKAYLMFNSILLKSTPKHWLQSNMEFVLLISCRYNISSKRLCLPVLWITRSGSIFGESLQCKNLTSTYKRQVQFILFNFFDQFWVIFIHLEWNHIVYNVPQSHGYSTVTALK